MINDNGNTIITIKRGRREEAKERKERTGKGCKGEEEVTI